MGGFEYLVSAYHTVSEEDSGGNQPVAIEGELKASTWSLGIDGPKPVLNAKVELSPEADTLTITGGVPRLKPEVRLAFKSTDALGGSDQVGCFPVFGERVTLGGCESGPSALLPGQSAIDEISHSLPPHIDITEVNTYLSDGVLTVVFHLRDLPDRLTFNRTGVPEGQMEYIWQVSVDVDNDKETGIEGADFALLAFHVPRQSKVGNNSTQSIENGTEAAGWELSSDGGVRGLFFGSATLEAVCRSQHNYSQRGRSWNHAAIATYIRGLRLYVWVRYSWMSRVGFLGRGASQVWFCGSLYPGRFRD